MPATFLGVRHHSPACARLVAATIDELRPAHVLIEGPADVNDRIDELLLGHELPIAVFSYQRRGTATSLSWAPLCDYSPEWVALTRGRAAGAEVRFIDLPAWHSAFRDRENRYSDADSGTAGEGGPLARLLREFAVDNTDTLWDHLVESQPDEGMAARLDAFFDLIRVGTPDDDPDAEREEHMARWVRAALADAGDRPVVVVTGGFHRPALVELADRPEPGWPEVPRPPADAVGESYLVPYSHRRMDAFVGYQSGMPSPGYYQRLWEAGPEQAAADLVRSVTQRLRERRQPVSTADLIAARTMAEGLARLRGHRHPARTDVLDGLVSALVTEGMEQRLPWAHRGPLGPGAHPVVVEMVAALTGDAVGTLHPDTPAPPLLKAVEGELAALGLDGTGEVVADLREDAGRRRSRVLHRLRVLGVPGFTRTHGPSTGADPVSAEWWTLQPTERRIPALIEAAANGATLADAAAAVLTERATAAGTDVAALARILFGAVLCGVDELSARLGDLLAEGVGSARDLGDLGVALATALGLWRHDRLLGTAGSPVLAAVIDAGTRRALWLLEGVRGGPAPADLPRLAAVTAVRDAVLHGGDVLDLDRSAVLSVAARIAVDQAVPPDLRGAASGLCWSLGGQVDPAGGVPAEPATVGDWLAGLFAVAREEVLATGSGDGVLAVLDGLVAGLTEDEFLVALPALRQAFEFFPPAERETIAGQVLLRHGNTGPARALLRSPVPPMVAAEAAALEARVDRLLAAAGLGGDS